MSDHVDSANISPYPETLDSIGVMSSSFAFIPRNVRKAVKAQAPSSNVRELESGKPPLLTERRDEKPDVASKGKAKAATNPPKSLPDEHYAILISLALSDHSIWSDPDLRHTIEQHTERFIPLSHLLRHSSILNLAGLGKDVLADETSIVKALRAHASDILDVRILVAGPSQSWNGKEDPGGYEVRRKNREGNQPSQNYTRDDWERRSIYLENIPIQYRSVSGIAHLTRSLLPQPALTMVQSITLPPHHKDGPNDYPKCKGFALVTMADLRDVELLLQEWPWNRSIDQHPAESPNHHEEVREAAKFGLRVLSKARWDLLKAQYLSYQRKLLDELVAFNEIHEPSNLPPANDIKMQEHTEECEPAHQLPTRTTTLASPYPLNCLVFVRNIHPDTNKTTLRKLFSAAFDVTSSNNQIGGLDYVDFNKGMDSCYVRLASPHHSQLLVDHFTSHSITQGMGLDDIGAISDTENAIAMEFVQGKREEFYWDKVPEKVRKQAVQKAVDAQQSASRVEAVPDEGPKRKKRKRDR